MLVSILCVLVLSEEDGKELKKQQQQQQFVWLEIFVFLWQFNTIFVCECIF